MHITVHAGQRMNQRGITKEMIRLVLEYGELQGGKIDLNQEGAARLVARLHKELKIAKKLLDKGGMTVVSAEGFTADESVIVTAYNHNPSRRSRKWKAKKSQNRKNNLSERTFSSQKRHHERVLTATDERVKSD
jgi:hypothetical protein